MEKNTYTGARSIDHKSIDQREQEKEKKERKREKREIYIVIG